MASTMKLKQLSVAVLLLSGTLISVHADQRPNVLFIISDDLNTFLGCYGDRLAKTPNIDRLAARGVRFDRAYCQYPLCGPSRNSMLTGLYPNSSGILLNGQVFRQSVPSQVSLPQAFRQAGYFAARLGKLYHYGVPNCIGTDGHDDPASWELEMNPAGVDRLEEMPRTFSLQPGQFGGTPSWHASPKSDDKHTDGLTAANAEWVLERCARDKDRPFFLAVGFFRPHTPYVAPTPYFDLYPQSDMPLVQGVKKDQADIPAAALDSYRGRRNQFTPELRRQCAQAYYASISFLDAQVGKVISALDRLGLAENTIIVFTSDHGYHMGEHGLWQKMSIFEHSARVPLLIVAPGQSQKRSVARAPVGLIDLYPTLAQLCDVKTPDNLQGQSLVPILKDPEEKGRGWTLTQVDRNRGAKNPEKRFSGYSLRTPRWRYTEWDEGRQGRELYDHSDDPKELTNLADEPAHAETVAMLSKKLHTAVAATFPPSGKTPRVEGSLWMPLLINPDVGVQPRTDR
jgi:iduronate 2-sulfatase